MLQIHWLILLLLSILSVIYFHFILFTLTNILIIILAICLALEVNTRDLTELNHFKNNRLFDFTKEISLIGRDDFQRTSFFNCLNSISFRSSPVQQFFGRKQTNYQQKYLNNDDKSSETYTGDAKIDEQINDLINLLLRDYVYSWYANVSSNQEFINELKLVLQTIIRLLVGRISKINKIHYITTKLVDNFVQHLKLYRMAKQHLKSNNIELTPDNLKESFFNFELQSESNRFCRDAVSEKKEFCLNYLTELTDILEYLILPPDIFNNRTIKYFVNSVIINSTFYPLLDLLSDPDFINQSLISICKTRKLNISLSESFLIILRSSANKEELTAVQESLREEIASQRSKDTGGDDDFEIKQQLSSLCYVNSIIKERLKLLNEGVNSEDSSKINQEENNNFNSQKNDLFSLTFDFVLSNPLALTYFFEYMITINKQSYLNFYLSVEGFRLSVEQKMVSIQMKESQELIKANECDELTSRKVSNSANVNQTNDYLNGQENLVLESLKDQIKSEQDQQLFEKLEMQMQRKLKKLKDDNEKAIWLNNLISRAREEARNIFDTYLSPTCAKPNHRIIVDDWMIHDLRRKIDKEELSETWFDTVHQHIYQRLREEEIFFSSFKRSIHYYKLLKELGLLKNSTLRDKTNQSNNKTNISSTSQQQSNSKFYLEPDNDNNSIKSNHSSYDTESLSSTQGRKSTELQEISSLLSRDETESADKSIEKISKNFISFDADITSTGITREFGKEFGVYCISIVRKDYQSLDSDTEFKEEKWCVVRRYSDFYNFHQHSVKLFPQIGKLSLPGKKPFANINQEFLEQRKQSLNSYLKHLLNLLNNSQVSSENSNFNRSAFRDHILQFFDSGNYLPKSTKSSANNNSQILTKTMNTVLNPFKSMKNKPGNLIEGITKINPFGTAPNNQDRQAKNQSSTSSKSTSNQLTPSFSSSSLSNFPVSQNQPNLSPKNQPFLSQSSNQFSTNSTVDTNLIGAKNLIESETNIPLRILLLLMDEIFDLKKKSYWLRRRIFNVIKQIIQTTYGSTINRKIISTINMLFSSSYVESYIKNIKKTLWPNGYRAMPSPERDKSTKLRTKVATKTLLLSIIPDDLTAIVGGETSRKSVMGLFNMLQSDVLNRRLVIVIFETFLIQLFPENEFDKVFEKLHSSRTKYKDKLDNQATASWPPYLSRMNLNSNLSSNSDPSNPSSKTSPIHTK